MKTVFKWIAKALSTGLSFVLLLWPFSPRPACWFLRNVFRFGTYIRPKDYSTLRARVKITRSLRYASSCQKCVLDVISPVAPATGPLPVVFWLHGGAYIGGDKADVEGYCVPVSYTHLDVYKRQAMTRAQCEAAMKAGYEAAAAQASCDVIGLGEMGICNTSTTAAVASVLLGKSVAETVSYTHLNDIRRHKGHPVPVVA